MSKAEELLAEITKATIQKLTLEQQIERLTTERKIAEDRVKDYYTRYQKVLAEK